MQVSGGDRPYQRSDEVGGPVEDHGEAEEVDAARPHPLQPGHHAADGPSEDVHEAQDGEQEGRLGVLIAQLLGVAHHEHGRDEEAQHHDGRRHRVDEEATVPEDGEVQQLALGLAVLLLLRPVGPLLALPRRVHGGGDQGLHERRAHAAVEQDAAQDEEAAPPAVVVLEDLAQRREAAQGHGAPRRRQPVGQRALLAEVAVEHDERRLEIEGQAQT